MTGTKVALAVAGSFAAASALLQFAQSDLPTWVGQVGFPIAVAMFLLLEMRKKSDEMTKAFNRLARAIERLHDLDLSSSDGE